MANRISVTKLGKLLKDKGFVSTAFTTTDLKKGRVEGVSNETYGKDSRVYIYTGTPEARTKLERFLRRNDVKFNPSYHPGSGTVEVCVTYFQGDRCWE